MSKQEKIKISFNVAVISALIAFLVAAILLLNYYQISKHDPLESDALKTLVERSFENPDDDQLRQDVRQLDLLARKAFFTAKWQTRLGSIIMLIAAALFVISMRIYSSETKSVERPQKSTAKEYIASLLAQRWILGIGSLLLILAFVVGIRSQSYVNQYAESKAELAMVNEDVEETAEDAITIELVQVGEKQDTAAEIAPVLEQGMRDDDTASTEQEQISPTQTPFPTLAEIKANFASFRGFFGNGIADFKNIPTSWDAKSGKNILWKTEIPVHGYNSPVIWGDKVFVAGGSKTQRVVYCLDRHTGKIMWEQEVKNVEGGSTKVPKTTDDTGLSAASIATDGRRVFAIFGNGDLICFDMDGNRVWSRGMGVPDNHYGHSSSLLSYKEKLFVQYDSNKGGKVYALQVADGKIIWEKVRNTKISWASPIIADINGKKQLILSSNPIVAGYDINTGKELWSVDCMYGEVGPSAAYGSGLIFAANEYAKLVAIDPANNYEIKWEADEYLPEVASPVVSNGLVFIATSYSTFVCYDAVSGEKQWEQEFDNGFYASPIIVGNKIYATDMDGVTHIMKVDRNYQSVADPEMHEKIVTTPAFADGRIYIRGDKYLYCIGK
jgi:outer membrane protein assembly factor BamB